MNAMLFAAGLGTRLRPLTNHRPKALVEVAGQSLLSHNLDKLIEADCEQVVINIHYFGEQILANVEAMPAWRERIIISDERDQILETGGGLLAAKTHLDQGHFLTHNVDILSNLNLRTGLMAQHLEKHALVTLATRDRATSRYLLFDKASHLLCGWTNVKTGEVKMARPRPLEQLSRRAFSGVAAYSPKIFNFLKGRNGEKFSIVDTWLAAAATEEIYSYSHDDDWWIDVGTPEKVAEAEALLAQQ